MHKQAVSRLTTLFLLLAMLLLAMPAGEAPARQTRAGAKASPAPLTPA